MVFRLIAAASLAVFVGFGGPAVAQQFGQPPSGGPQFGQTPFGQPQSGQPPFGQPSAPPAPEPFGGQGAPSILGAWSGTTPGDMGPILHTDFFGQDGSFVSVARLGNGSMIRVWGAYRVQPAGNNQVRIEFSVQGFLPQQFCAEPPGGPRVCRPYQLPLHDVVMSTFTSPNTVQSQSLENPGPMLAEQRDPNPYLLQAPVPAQMVIATVAPPQYAQPQAPIGGGGSGYRPPSYGPRCDDLQQRRICSINDGHLVSSGGCLVCVQ